MLFFIAGIVLLAVAIVSRFILAIWRRFVHRCGLKNLHGRAVVISGCDSGFGNLLAKRLNKLGFVVFAGCLTEDGANNLQNEVPQIKVFQLDITSEDSVKKALSFVKSQMSDGTSFWALVNNAGIQGNSFVDQWISTEDYKTVAEVNFFGHVRMVHTFYPLILDAKGRIVFMCSSFSHIAPAGQGPYNCSKYAIKAYAQTLRNELARSEVSVVMITPGMYITPLTDAEKIVKNLLSQWQHLDDSIRANYSYAQVEKMIDGVRDSIRIFSASNNNDDVVDAYVHAIMAKYPRPNYRVGSDAIVWRVLQIMPDELSAWLYSQYV